MGNVNTPELLIVLLVVVLLFGAKRLPDVARGIGQSLRVFKAELRGDTTERPADGPDTRS